MAKLNRPAESTRATSAPSCTPKSDASSPTTLSSPALCQISLEESLQSHGNDDKPPSPPSQGSGPTSFSPADCRTLKKILSDVGHSSPPSTPSHLELNEQPFAKTDCMSSISHNGTGEENGFQLADDEAADTGYEDENDSMELSEGVAGGYKKGALLASDGHTSPTVSYKDRRLRESVSTHDEIEKLKYARQRRWSGAKPTKPKRVGQKHQGPIKVIEDDTIEDVMNLPGNLASPARPLEHGYGDLYRTLVPEDIKQLDRLRLTMEKVLENERADQEHAACEEEPGVSIPDPDALESERTTLLEQPAIHDASDADNEEDTTTDDPSEGRNVKGSQVIMQDPKQQAPLIDTAFEPTEESTVLVPSNSTSATLAPGRNYAQFVANQNIPESPFTKTLRYFKQYKGTEDSPSKRRRTTALPEEIADLVEAANSPEAEMSLENLKHSEHSTPGTAHKPAFSANFALAGLEGMATPQASTSSTNVQGTFNGLDCPDQPPTTVNAVTGSDSQQREMTSESAQDSAQTQLILYPRHPAFVNAIAMIPATMFWMTAAPVVKYTGIAVDLLIDKLRDTYL